MVNGNEPANEPVEQTVEGVTPPVVAEVANHVDEAATSATEAATSTGDEGWKTVAEELRGLRGDIKKLMKGSTPSTPAPSTPAPAVAVEVPKPVERKIRRGHRKVTRRG